MSSNILSANTSKNRQKSNSRYEADRTVDSDQRKATAAEIVNERLQAVQQQLDEQRKQYIHLQEKAKENKEKFDDAQKKCIS